MSRTNNPKFEIEKGLRREGFPAEFSTAPLNDAALPQGGARVFLEQRSGACAFLLLPRRKRCRRFLSAIRQLPWLGTERCDLLLERIVYPGERNVARFEDMPIGHFLSPA
jgi:hypothetical protein